MSRLVFISLDQFDPRLLDGGTLDILTRLRFFQKRGVQVLVLSFPSQDQPDKHIDKDMFPASRNAPDISSTISRFTFHGLEYWQEILPPSQDRKDEFLRQVNQRIIIALRQSRAEYVFTADEGYLGLQAGFLLGLAGAHWFYSLDNVQRFGRYPLYIDFLKKRTIFANSRHLQSEIKTRLGLDSVLWYPSIDFARYRVEPERSRTLGIGFHSKGQKLGNMVVAEVARRLPERNVIVVGADRPSWHQAPDNISFLGKISDMRGFYRGIDLLLVPSSEDSFPRVILEAAANGIPSIANRVGGIPEAVGESGMLIDVVKPLDGVWDVASFADQYVQAIRSLLGDEECYRDYRRRALAWARTYEARENQMAGAVYKTCIQPNLPNPF